MRCVTSLKTAAKETKTTETREKKSREAIHKRDRRVPGLDSIRRKEFQVPTALTNTPLIPNHSEPAICTGGRYFSLPCQVVAV